MQNAYHSLDIAYLNFASNCQSYLFPAMIKNYLLTLRKLLSAGSTHQISNRVTTKYPQACRNCGFLWKALFQYI